MFQAKHKDRRSVFRKHFSMVDKSVEMCILELGGKVNFPKRGTMTSRRTI